LRNIFQGFRILRFRQISVEHADVILRRKSRHPMHIYHLAYLFTAYLLLQIKREPRAAFITDPSLWSRLYPIITEVYLHHVARCYTHGRFLFAGTAAANE